MKRLLIFNPENDLALASGGRSFTPPAAAVRLAEACCLLPCWWAEEGDVIFAPAAQAKVAKAIEQQGLSCRIATADDLGSIDVCLPWGWSEHTVRCLRDAGVPERALVQDAELLRQLSHRRVGEIQVRERLGLEPAMEVSDAKTLDKVLGDDFQDWLAKVPWSCSGRGVVMFEGLTREYALFQARGIIRRQGSVILERKLERKADFAALFYCRKGVGTSFLGWSVFLTEKTRYMGNVVCPQGRMEELLGKICSVEEAKSWVSRLETALAVYAESYEGPMGVDMMVLEDGSIYPCVEVNMRRTMGHVAMDAASRLERLEGFPETMDGQAHYVVKATVDGLDADSPYPFLDAVSAGFVERMIIGDV